MRGWTTRARHRPRVERRSFITMDDERKTEPEHRRGRGLTLGAAVALGIALGAAVFVVTREAIWVAIGPALGVVIGAAIGYRDR